MEELIEQAKQIRRAYYRGVIDETEFVNSMEEFLCALSREDALAVEMALSKDNS
jgi:hypothetical protein